uniref:Uncharacterized protein n=1 Tax=Fervidicoccus fontis TaxID=683846 RepID=A0A7J3ZKQ3_9CREN
MACFVMPLLVGVVLAIIRRLWRGAERSRLDMLVYLMLGGALVLAAEHVWHGEVVPWPPFLTAMKSPQAISVLVNEVVRVGGTMTLAVTGAWLSLLGLARRLQAGVEPPKPPVATLGARGDG